MTENNNEELIRTFLKAEQKEIIDNGFSRRVMRKLPAEERKILKIFVRSTLSIGILLFFLFNGVEWIKEIFVKIFNSGLISNLQSIDTTSLIISGIVLAVFGIQRICSIE